MATLYSYTDLVTDFDGEHDIDLATVGGDEYLLPEFAFGGART
jgi:hypothetical protein